MFIADAIELLQSRPVFAFPALNTGGADLLLQGRSQHRRQIKTRSTRLLQ